MWKMALSSCGVLLLLLAACSCAKSSAPQKRTMSEMAKLNTALEAYSIDWNHYPTVPSVADLKPILEPDYGTVLEATDGWRHPFRYTTDATGKSYWLVSPGKDGKFEREDATEYVRGEASTPEGDLVAFNGKFLRWMPGEQRYQLLEPAP